MTASEEIPSLAPPSNGSEGDAVSDYTLTVTLHRSYEESVAAVREALQQQGFGVLTEIDVRKTLKAKLDVDVPPQLILGACRPELAHRALTAVPSLGALLPCNVVVRVGPDGRTVVEAIDPDALARLEGSPVVHAVATEARQRLRAALDALVQGEVGGDPAADPSTHLTPRSTP